MQRIPLTPRANWGKRVEALGFTFHSSGQLPYWDESACYAFTVPQIDLLEAVTLELRQRCLQLVEHVVRNNLYADLLIPESWVPLIRRSWEAQEPSLYGRFDFCFDGSHAPKLYEYNADTPTSLFEAAVVQWHWLQDAYPDADQFNSIHERLIDRWRELNIAGRVHLACVRDHEEDFVTTVYLEDTAAQAGLPTRRIFMHEIGWDGRQFVDLSNQPIHHCFKLYPWEWMLEERFGSYLLHTPWQAIEPAWKMILSNKAALAMLWEMFPGHPNLLPTFFEADPSGGEFPEKPVRGREGSNVTLHAQGHSAGTSGPYGNEGRVFQALCLPPRFAGNFAVVGSWIVGNEPAGIGIRESKTPITGNTSRFIPHYFQ